MSQETDKVSVPSKQATPEIIAGLKMTKVVPKKSTEQSLADLVFGDQFDAMAQVLGKEMVNLQGAILGDGTQFLTIPFEKTEFTFEQLFTNFVSADSSLFVFDNVDIHIEKSTQADAALTIDFIGELRIDKSPLDTIAHTLKLYQPPLLTAQIITQDGDLSDKITPQSVVLQGAPTIELNLLPTVSLTNGCLQVTIIPGTDEKGWIYQPSVSGTLEIADIADDPLELECLVSYEGKNLNLKASAREVKGLFDVDGLSLDSFEVTTVLGKERSLALDAVFTAAGRVYQLGGAIDENKAGVYTRESRFSLNDLNGIVTEITGGVLSLPTFDVSLSNLLLGFANADGQYAQENLEKGVTLRADIDVFGHKANASVHFNQEGVELSAGLSDVTIGPVTITNAEMALNLYQKAAKKDSSFEITGETEVEGITVECKLVYEKHNGKWKSILYAMLNAESFVFSNIFPKARGTFVDSLGFNKLGFVYSSFDGTSQNTDFEFPVKEGLQLVGHLKQVPALSDLTQNEALNLVLSAYLGPRKEISIALPDTRLNLGRSVKTSPIRIGIELMPQPSLEMIFGLDVTVPRQDTPLHFDANLSVGMMEATGGGTMKNYWRNPFGVQGIKIGPELAMEVGIIYAQFIATGIPSSFGFVGGLALGDVTAEMAAKISENPADEILMGHLKELSPANLVSFVNEATGANISVNDIPNFFALKDLEIYIAPKGGRIGTVEFEQGLSFTADLVMFGKRISVHTRLADNGLEAEGHIDKIDIGLLKIQGKEGGDVELDIELTSRKQSVFIDGEIGFFGRGVGLSADVSNSGIEFSFEQSFLDLLKYTVEGKSKGALDHPQSLDFSLRAEFDNSLTGYLKRDLSKKMETAIRVVDTDIRKAQNEVKRASKAYDDELAKAQAELNHAGNVANRYLENAKKELEKEKNRYRKNLARATSDLDHAKAVYDKALNQATAAVDKAQADFIKEVRQAQAKVDSAEREYTNALNKAKRDLNNARRSYDNAMQSAKRSFNAAQNKVNTLNNLLRTAKRKWKAEKRKRIPNPFKMARYGSTIVGLETAIGTASITLKAAKGVMSGVTKGAEYAAFESAKATLEAVKQGGKYAAFESAKVGLQQAKNGAKYVAFESARQTLQAVKEGSHYTAWKAAEESLDLVKSAGQEALDIAQDAVDGVGKNAVWLALKAAEEALEGVKHGPAFVAFQSANVVLEGAKQSAKATLWLGQYLAEHLGDIVDVRHVELESHLKGIENGDLFKAHVDLCLVGHDVKTTIDFSPVDVARFMEDLFKQAMNEAEKLVIKS